MCQEIIIMGDLTTTGCTVQSLNTHMHKWRMYLRSLMSCVWVGDWVCLCVGNQTSRQLGRWRRCSFFLSSPNPISILPTPYSNATHTHAPIIPFYCCALSTKESQAERVRERERREKSESCNPSIPSVNNGHGSPRPPHSKPPHSTLHSILIGRTLSLALSLIRS